MRSKEFSGLNFSYAIDSNHRFLSISDGMLELYPHLKIGNVCHKAIYDLDCPCPVCPLEQPKDREITVYNPVLDSWVSVMCVDMPWANDTICSLVSCSVIKNSNEAITHRLPSMAGYDVFFEMNLTRNSFRRFFRGMSARQVDYEEEPLDSLMKRTQETLVHPLDQKRFSEFWNMDTIIERLEQAGGTLHDEFVEINSRGEWDLVHCTVVPDSSVGTFDDIIVAMYTVIRSPQLAHLALNASDIDISKIEAAEKTTDLQTLLTESEFLKQLDKRMASPTPGDKCLMCFDVENFRFFNRWISREEGDQLLERFASYLRKLDRDHNVLPCHFGADRFGLVLPLNTFLCESVAHDLKKILEDSCEELEFRLAIGATLIDSSKVSVVDMVDEARTASRRSLSTSSAGITWYNEDIARDREALAHTTVEVAEAVKREQFIVHVQPKVRMSDKKIIGAEALARWIHPERGIISPSVFIPILESTGDIAKLDIQIWKQTFAQISSWLKAGLSVPPISVNVSRYDLDAMDVATTLDSLAKKYDVDPHFVEVEITESTLSANREKALCAINELRANGFAVAVDDFGSGYSSLNMLKDIPADIIKLDLKFLELDEENVTKGSIILKSVIEMSHLLNIPVIMEGVSTQERADMVASLGCQYAQGWLYHRAMPLSEFEHLLTNPEDVLVEGIVGAYASNSKLKADALTQEFDEAILKSLKTPMVMYELNGSNIDIAMFNDEFANIIGAEELLRRRWSIQNYIHKKDHSKIYGAFQRAEQHRDRITHAHMRFYTEAGEVVPYGISLSFISEDNGIKRFLGLPAPIDENVSSHRNGLATIIDRNWIEAALNVGDVTEETIESLSSPIAYYALKNEEVHLMGCNRSLLRLFKITPDEIETYASRDVLSNMPQEEINGFLSTLDEAYRQNGRCVKCINSFYRAFDDKMLSCRMRIHFVREGTAGLEFLASIITD